MLTHNKIFYGWYIAIGCFISLVIVFGSRLSFQVFFVALVNDFGWSRASTAGIFSMSMLVFAVTSPLFGWIMDRFGPRILFTIGAIFFGGGLIICNWVTTQAELYFWYGGVASIGITILGLANYATVIARWFRRWRSSAMGLAFAGTGLGTFLIIPLTEYWITIWGWRGAMIMQGVLLLVMIVPISMFLLRLDPTQLGLAPDGLQQETPANRLRRFRLNTTGHWARPWPNPRSGSCSLRHLGDCSRYEC